MSRSRWGAVLIIGAVAAWLALSQFRSRHVSVYAGVTPVAFTADIVSRSFDDAGIERMVGTMIAAQRSDGSQVHVNRTSNGQSAGVKSIIDVAASTRTTVDPLTQSRTTYKMSADEVMRHRSPLAACGESFPMLKADGAPGVKLLGWDVVHFTGVIPGQGEGLAVERWLAPGLNCLALKEISVRPGFKTIVTVERVTLGEPDRSLFDIPAEYPERRPSDVLKRAYDQRRIPNIPNPATTNGLDRAYEGNQK